MSNYAIIYLKTLFAPNKGKKLTVERGRGYESRHPGRRVRHAHQRGEPFETKADDRNRGSPHPMAHHEGIQPLRT